MAMHALPERAIYLRLTMNNRAILEGAASLTPPSIAFSSIQLSTGKCLSCLIRRGRLCALHRERGRLCALHRERGRLCALHNERGRLCALHREVDCAHCTER
ncbi:hypothetical protein DPMN_072762 [Dreissena polymorpha]|uniref:Uncharacterized protein n=1 Tax=Dreissena polymorpha TaxID=45954 RepID=A0A9D4BXW9_DREPO|nr:hypothetical protein DPMN_072762 [Dreissena polymorpha]